MSEFCSNHSITEGGEAHLGESVWVFDNVMISSTVPLSPRLWRSKEISSLTLWFTKKELEKQVTAWLLRETGVSPCHTLYFPVLAFSVFLLYFVSCTFMHMSVHALINFTCVSLRFPALTPVCHFSLSVYFYLYICLVSWPDCNVLRPFSPALSCLSVSCAELFCVPRPQSFGLPFCHLFDFLLIGR